MVTCATTYRTEIDRLDDIIDLGIVEVVTEDEQNRRDITSLLQ